MKAFLEPGQTPAVALHSASWRAEAERTIREIREFGRPITPEYDHHPVRDYIVEAFEAGIRSVRE